MESAEDRRARSIQQEQVSELETLVQAACSRGVEAGRCRDIIEGAVKRARWKGALLPHLDSQLLLSTLEQAKGEIASLTDVTATNAALMREELLEHQERAEERATKATSSEEVAAASVCSLPGAPGSLSSSGGTAPEAGTLAGQPGSPAGRRATPFAGPAAAAAAAVAGAVGMPGWGEEPSGHGGSVSGMAPLTPHLISAADAVAPMRDFASEVAAEAAVEADEERTFRHSLSMKKSNSGELRTAATYDFETAMSPRAGYHERDAAFDFSFSPPDRQGSSEGLLEGPLESRGLGGEGGAAWELAEEEGEEEEEQEQEGVGAEEGEEAGELLVFVSGAGQTMPLASPAAREPAAASSPQAGPPAGPSTPPSAPLSMGSMHCWAGMPPGFNPAAVVEGGPPSSFDDSSYECIDPQSPTGVGAVDLESYTSAPFTLHSVTPPRHVMQELAASVQGQLRLSS